MNDEEINLAMADAMGWRKEDGVYVWTANNINCTCDELWDWANDLNAMHLAEKVLGNKLSQYGEWLCEMTDVNERNYPSCYIWHKTARQRAEAFLRTLGKWDDQSGERTEMVKEVQK